jgi:hypothetical protein
MRRLGTGALLVAVGFVVWSGPVACGPSGSAGMQCASSAGYTENGSMVTQSEGSGCGNLTGTVPPGGACTSPGICQPACCSCGTYASDVSVAVAYCLNSGVCAEPDVTCCTFIAVMAGQDAGMRACQ